MEISHHQPVSETRTDVYPVYATDLEGNDYLDCFYMRVTFGRGRGGATEPRITAEFTPAELRNFAVDLLSLVAVEEPRA